MQKIFEEFMKRVQEEQQARQQRGPGNSSQFHQSSQSHARGRHGDPYSFSQAEDWQEAERRGREQQTKASFKEQFERSKRAEAQERYQEFLRMERENEQAKARSRQATEDLANKAYDSFVAGKAEAERSGLVRGVIKGLQQFFKK